MKELVELSQAQKVETDQSGASTLPVDTVRKLRRFIRSLSGWRED
jgi:hypothetical protein